MPPQDSNKPDKSTPAIPQASGSAPLTVKSGLSDENKAMREDWNKLSKAKQNSYFDSLPVKDRDEFAMRIGLYGPIQTTIGPGPKTGSIPWMKEKAGQILAFGANQLPTIGGVSGGLSGGAIGTAIAPESGVAPVTGAVIGSGVGGGIGEGVRQKIFDLTGANDFEDPETKTWGARFKSMAKEGAGQAAGELLGQGSGKVLRLTLERSLAKLYYAGGLKYGDPLGGGDMEKVIHDVMATEKAGSKATTVGDLLGVIKQTKKDIGNEVDVQMVQGIRQNGQVVPLGKAHADTTPVVNAVNSLLTADPSIVKRAAIDKAGKEEAFLRRVKKEALAFQQHLWTYEELTSERIRLNNELAPLYTLPPGEQRVYLLDHPDLAIKKKMAEAIRDVIYPQMDSVANWPKGTTALLQNKRGALMSLENQVTEHLSDIMTKARQAKGAPLTEKTNISSYGTSAGKPGFAIHRLTGIVHTPNPEFKADKKVAQAFGNTVGSKARLFFASPAGSPALGNELLSMPLRELVNPSQPKKPEDQDAPVGPQSSVARPKELIEKAKRLNPSAQGQTAYAHTAVNPQTGHKIGSNGNGWYDIQTGAKVA